MTTAMADSPNIELPDGYRPTQLIEAPCEAIESYQGHELPRTGTTLGVCVDGPFVDLWVRNPGDPRDLCLTLSRDDARRLFGPLFVHFHVEMPPVIPTGEAWSAIAREAHGPDLECGTCEERAFEAIARVANAQDRAALMAKFGTRPR